MPETPARSEVTVTQLARAARVSVSLVSRYVNRHPSLQISDVKRRQIEQAAKRLGGMPRGRGGVVAANPSITRHVLLPIVGQFGALADATRCSVASQVYVHTRRALEQAGFRFSHSLYEADTLVPGVSNLITQAPRLADGLLLGTSFVDDGLTKLILDGGIPHVSIEPRAEAAGLNTVLVDEKVALADAVTALRDLGHTRIGYFGTREYYRFAPIAGAIIGAGLPFTPDQGCVFPKPPDKKGSGVILDASRINDSRPLYSGPFAALGTIAAERFVDWLPRRGDVTALICSSDHLAAIAVKAMRDAGLTPGRDLSLVGFGNAAAHLAQPDDDALRLTTIDQRPDRVGQCCAEVLIQQIRHDRRGPIHETIPATFITRDTLGPATSRPSLLRRLLP